MRIEYDNEVDGVYIWFVDDIEKEKAHYDQEIWPEEFHDEIGLLFDDHSKLMGLEIQPASKYLKEEFLAS